MIVVRIKEVSPFSGDLEGQAAVLQEHERTKIVWMGSRANGAGVGGR